MELCEQEMKRGYIWFFLAGVVSVLVVCFLYRADHWVTEHHEHDYTYTAEMMGELREAQTSLGVHNVDQRTQ